MKKRHIALILLIMILSFLSSKVAPHWKAIQAHWYAETMEPQFYIEDCIFGVEMLNEYDDYEFDLDYQFIEFLVENSPKAAAEVRLKRRAIANKNYLTILVPGDCDRMPDLLAEFGARYNQKNRVWGAIVTYPFVTPPEWIKHSKSFRWLEPKNQ